MALKPILILMGTSNLKSVDAFSWFIWITTGLVLVGFEGTKFEGLNCNLRSVWRPQTAGLQKKVKLNCTMSYTDSCPVLLQGSFKIYPLPDDPSMSVPPRRFSKLPRTE